MLSLVVEHSNTAGPLWADKQLQFWLQKNQLETWNIAPSNTRVPERGG